MQSSCLLQNACDCSKQDTFAYTTVNLDLISFLSQGDAQIVSIPVITNVLDH